MKKYEVWVADLNPQQGTEPGKVRPVVIVQTNLLNGIHPSTLACPCSTNVRPGATILRLHLSAGTAGLTQDSDILLDQIRVIDNRRFLHKAGQLSMALQQQLDENLKIVLDLP
jgi:mRNA interferase MazF